MSIWRAVIPSRVPATLKSMSPRASSTPWMSVSTACLPSRVTRPMAIPATGALMGTPASIRASVQPQTAAIEVDPFELRISETSRIVYGQSSTLGMTGSIARSASAPWPISRRPGLRRGRASPTEKGGKL